MCKVVNFFLFLFWSLSVFAADTPEVCVSIIKAFVENGQVECVLNVTPPEGWKVSKKPSIKLVDNNSSVQSLVYSDSDDPKILEDGSCEVTFFGTTKETAEETKFTIEMSSYLCKDTCVIDKKVIEIFPQEHVDAKKPSIPIGGLATIWLILFALAGGFLLNFMPCVFPVLLLKLKMLMEDNNKQAILGSISGNFATFFAIAILFTILKILGVTLSWGMHFHNLMFLCITAVIVFTFTLYSFELISFEPSFKNVKTHKDVFIRNFVSSIIATLISLPCTGPLVGTTTAIALNGPTWLMYVVILCLATGFSAPYIISLFIPFQINEKFGQHAPLIKKIMSAGIGIVFSWLLWLVCQRLSFVYIIPFAILFIVTALLFKANKKKAGCISIAALLILSVAAGFFEGECPTFKKEISVDWQEFSPEKITPELVKNNLVLVNIGADWCVTCQYYKRTVFEEEKFKKFANKYNIKLFEGDFSLKDEKILEFIKAHKRVGVPFTIVFGPKNPEGKVLSERISFDEIKTVIKESATSEMTKKVEEEASKLDLAPENIEKMKEEIANKPSKIDIKVDKSDDLKDELEKVASERKKEAKNQNDDEEANDEAQEENATEEADSEDLEGHEEADEVQEALDEDANEEEDDDEEE